MLQPEISARVTLEASVSPSEDPSKVAGALANIAGTGVESVRGGPNSSKLVADDPRVLVSIRDKLRDRHVRAAARRQLLLNKKGRRATLMLNRQAAAAGVLALCGSPGESPLGPVFMTVESAKVDGAIDWLTAYETG